MKGRQGHVCVPEDVICYTHIPFQLHVVWFQVNIFSLTGLKENVSHFFWIELIFLFKTMNKLTLFSHHHYWFPIARSLLLITNNWSGSMLQSLLALFWEMLFLHDSECFSTHCQLFNQCPKMYSIDCKGKHVHSRTFQQEAGDEGRNSWAVARITRLMIFVLLTVYFISVWYTIILLLT